MGSGYAETPCWVCSRSRGPVKGCRPQTLPGLKPGADQVTHLEPEALPTGPCPRPPSEQSPPHTHPRKEGFGAPPAPAVQADLPQGSGPQPDENLLPKPPREPQAPPRHEVFCGAVAETPAPSRRLEGTGPREAAAGEMGLRGHILPPGNRFTSTAPRARLPDGGIGYLSRAIANKLIITAFTLKNLQLKA